MGDWEFRFWLGRCSFSHFTRSIVFLLKLQRDSIVGGAQSLKHTTLVLAWTIEDNNYQHLNTRKYSIRL
uniref:Uncharacterized protein n=1 Tax=Solanum tuberosum TaxID=4113 RepID=M1ARW5_SOLTU